MGSVGGGHNGNLSVTVTVPFVSYAPQKQSKLLQVVFLWGPWSVGEARAVNERALRDFEGMMRVGGGGGNGRGVAHV